MKTMRKGSIIKYCGNDNTFIKTWGEIFEVFHKEKEFLGVVSINKPEFGVCATIPCKECKLVDDERLKRWNMTVKEAIKNVTTKFYLISRDGKILCINGKNGGSYEMTEQIKHIDIINNICDGLPVITAIRIWKQN